MMRRFVKTALVVAALVLSMVPAASKADSMSGGPFSFAVGGGETITGNHFAFSAHQTPNGPSGYVVETQPATVPAGEFRVQGHVECLNVIGNHATIGIQIEKGEGTAAGFVGGSFYLDVTDNGPPVNGQSPDLFSNSSFFSAPPPQGVCTEFQPSVYALESGNILVHDASDPTLSTVASDQLGLAASTPADGSATVVGAYVPLSGAVAAGTYSAVSATGTDVEGTVTCLNVTGNLATVGVLVTQSNDASRPIGSGLYVYMQDNGPPDANGKFSNLLDTSGAQATAPTSCASSASPTTAFDGPIQVAG